MLIAVQRCWHHLFNVPNFCAPAQLRSRSRARRSPPPLAAAGGGGSFSARDPRRPALTLNRERAGRGVDQRGGGGASIDSARPDAGGDRAQETGPRSKRVGPAPSGPTPSRISNFAGSPPPREPPP